MYRIDSNGQMTRHDADFNRSEPDWLASDFLKMISFGPHGRRLVCVTKRNRILVWLLSNNARPIEAPFAIVKDYSPVRTPELTYHWLLRISQGNECRRNDLRNIIPDTCS